MIKKLRKRIQTRLKKHFLKSRKWLLVGFIVILGVMVLGLSDDSHINAAAYAPLLDTIAKGESGGNYNAYFGNPKNNDLRFTDMTVGEVMQWQADHIERGNTSSAVGKYQIISTTLAELVQALGIDHSQKFDEALQDRLAIALLERRGSIEYISKKLTREQFAANIAMEWAALPKATGPNPDDSYYAGDGVNASNIAVDEVFEALDTLQDEAKKKR